jgi:hypothetical protein
MSPLHLLRITIPPHTLSPTTHTLLPHTPPHTLSPTTHTLLPHTPPHTLSPTTHTLLPHTPPHTLSPTTHTLLPHTPPHTLSPTAHTLLPHALPYHRDYRLPSSAEPQIIDPSKKYRLAAMMKADGENLVEMTNLTAGIDHAQSGVSGRRHRRRALHPILSTSKLTFF